MQAAAVHADEIGFQQALDLNPADSGLRLVFADWLEEQTPPDPRGSGYRVLGELGRVPFANYPAAPIDWVWCGWTVSPDMPHLVHQSAGEDRSELPASWLRELPGIQDEFSADEDLCASFPTRHAAEDAAALAFARLSPEQQAAARGFPGSPDKADDTPPRR